MTPSTAKRPALLAGRSPQLQRPRASAAGWTDLDLRAVDTIRVLAADAVQKTGNGHPGTAMSLAPAAYLLYQNVMVHDPSEPNWLGRDRFVLSAGHSSLTQYIQLFLSGYGLELADLQALRTWGSLTPGHPEVHHTRGVEITTGPLGSGLASAVGMAMAQRRQRGLLDPDAAPAESPFDHRIYVIASDGDLMEGVSHESCSLAGHQQLGNLLVIYDANQISIEDDTRVAYSEDTAKRFEAYGWDVRTVDWRGDGDGTAYVEDVDALLEAIHAGQSVNDRPTIVILRTIIAWPAPTKQDRGSAHGAALGAGEVAAVKEVLGFDPQQSFPVERAVLAHARKVASRGKAAHRAWNRRYAGWRKVNPDRAALLDRLVVGALPEGLEKALPEWDPDPKGIATRAASGKILTALGPPLPELWGGSADLAESNNTTMGEQPSFVPTMWQTREWPGGPYGRTLHFGVREFGMGCILNGIALEGLTRPYGGTFLIFSDYMRGAVRLAALQQIPVTFVYTHDSIGLGEDGPTHQPIEQLAALRAMPGLDVVRPSDANETAVVWLAILRGARPTALALTRQALPVIDRRVYAKARNAVKGAYILADGGPDGSQTPDVILVATGSEVSLALDARHDLERSGIRTRVVSMPCREWFEAQPRSYRERVLPASVKARVSVEAGASFGWREVVGDSGQIVGIDHFGASADGTTLMREFGFTTAAVVKAAKTALRTARSTNHEPSVTAAPARSATEASRTDTTARRRPAAKAAARKEK